MAIDTRNKRASVLAAGLAACIAFPAPASPADAPWRVHVAGLYALSAATPPIIPGEPYTEPGGGHLGKGKLPKPLVRRIVTDARTPDPSTLPIKFWDKPLEQALPDLSLLSDLSLSIPQLPEDLDIIGQIHRDDEQAIEMLLNEDLLSPKRHARAALPADDDDAIQLILDEIGHQPQ
jgi:hypothetical protein